MTKRKWQNVALLCAGVIAVLLVMSGVGSIEQAPAGVPLYPYIARSFAGLAIGGAAVVALNERE